MADNYNRYLASDSSKEFKYRLQEYQAGKLRSARCHGIIAQVVQTQFGTIFTLVNKKFVFKIPLGFKSLDKRSLHPGDRVDFRVIVEEDTDQLFIFEFT